MGRDNLNRLAQAPIRIRRIRNLDIMALTHRNVISARRASENRDNIAGHNRFQHRRLSVNVVSGYQNSPSVRQELVRWLMLKLSPSKMLQPLDKEQSIIKI